MVTQITLKTEGRGEGRTRMRPKLHLPVLGHAFRDTALLVCQWYHGIVRHLPVEAGAVVAQAALHSVTRDHGLGFWQYS